MLPSTQARIMLGPSFNHPEHVSPGMKLAAVSPGMLSLDGRRMFPPILSQHLFRFAIILNQKLDLRLSVFRLEFQQAMRRETARLEYVPNMNLPHPIKPILN
jgi:hypothetical protein